MVVVAYRVEQAYHFFKGVIEGSVCVVLDKAGKFHAEVSSELIKLSPSINVGVRLTNPNERSLRWPYIIHHEELRPSSAALVRTWKGSSSKKKTDGRPT